MQNIVFGGAALSGEGGGYGFGPVERPQELVQHALDLGIKYFDTAPIYGFHESEKLLGKTLIRQREKVSIISKSGITWHDNKRVNLTNEPKVTQKMLEQSLRNLQTEYIDVYMIHWPDPRVDIRFPMEVLSKAKTQGKIKHIGLANTTAEELTKALEVDAIEYLQSECNLFSNQLMGLADLIKKYNINTMGWGTFDKGILSGRVTKTRKFAASDARSWAPWWKKSNWQDKVEKVESIQEKYQINMRDYALTYSLQQVDLPIIGAKSKEQLDSISDFISNKPEAKKLSEVLNELRR